MQIINEYFYRDEFLLIYALFVLVASTILITLGTFASLPYPLVTAWVEVCLNTYTYGVELEKSLKLVQIFQLR